MSKECLFRLAYVAGRIVRPHEWGFGGEAAIHSEKKTLKARDPHSTRELATSLYRHLCLDTRWRDDPASYVGWYLGWQTLI